MLCILPALLVAFKVEKISDFGVVRWKPGSINPERNYHHLKIKLEFLWLEIMRIRLFDIPLRTLIFSDPLLAKLMWM